MDTRMLGQTGQKSTLLTFGAIVLRTLNQDGANRMVELVRSHGVNHFDVAPTYGDAEVKLEPALRAHRDDIFLGCKTKARTKEGAANELEQSLERMGIENIDLYQFHAVTGRDELDAITSPDGALETFREAKASGIIDHIGLTSHGAPAVILDAIERIDDLETVMFPMNYTLLGKDDDEHDYRPVLRRAEEKGIGTIGIKTFAKGTWPPKNEISPGDRPYDTWYEPFDTQARIDECLNFTLSQGLTSITNAGDPKLIPMILDAAERFRTLSESEQRALMDEGSSRSSPVPKR
ncbi:MULTISPECIES: aldo/keto reductase [unclassified Haladaptatus]|uniref:aldo/keto reductase n=1 Tax=unclassified Haladaptatus TaxID=2622732 RepID=UPI0023E8EE9C|nr:MULTISPECIES: aldo/keto reductase [unclassified Haladaptatus]